MLFSLALLIQTFALPQIGDINNCGSPGNKCTFSPANGYALCLTGSCKWSCNAGYQQSLPTFSCVPIPPTPPIPMTSLNAFLQSTVIPVISYNGNLKEAVVNWAIIAMDSFAIYKSRGLFYFSWTSFLLLTIQIMYSASMISGSKECGVNLLWIIYSGVLVHELYTGASGKGDYTPIDEDFPDNKWAIGATLVSFCAGLYYISLGQVLTVVGYIVGYALAYVQLF